MSGLISILLIYCFNVIVVIHAQNSDDNKTKWSSEIMENWKSSLNEEENKEQNMPIGLKDPWNIRPERNMDVYETQLNNNRAHILRNRLRGSWNNNPQRHTEEYLGLGNRPAENNPSGSSGLWYNSPQRDTSGYLGLLGPQERIQNGYQGSWNTRPEINEYTMNNNQAKGIPNEYTMNNNQAKSVPNEYTMNNNQAKNIPNEYTMNNNQAKSIPNEETMNSNQAKSIPNEVTNSPTGITSEPTGSLKQKPTKKDILKSLKASLENAPTDLTASARNILNNDENIPPLQLLQSLKNSLLKSVLGAVAQSLRGNPGVHLSKNLTNDVKLKQRSTSLSHLNSSLNNPGSSDSSHKDTKASIKSNLPKDASKNLKSSMEGKQRNLTNSLGNSSSESVRRKLTGLSKGSPPDEKERKDSPPIKKPIEFEYLASKPSELQNPNQLPGSLMNNSSKKTSTEPSASLESPSKNSSGNLRNSHQSIQSRKFQNPSNMLLDSIIANFTELVLRSPGNITLTRPAGNTSNTDLPGKGSVMNIDMPNGLLGLLVDSSSRNKLKSFTNSLKISPARKTYSSIQMGTAKTTNELTGLVRRNTTRKLLNKFTGSSRKSPANNKQSRLQPDLFEISPREDTPRKLPSSVRRNSARKARRGYLRSRKLKRSRGKRAISKHTD